MSIKKKEDNFKINNKDQLNYQKFIIYIIVQRKRYLGPQIKKYEL